MWDVSRFPFPGTHPAEAPGGHWATHAHGANSHLKKTFHQMGRKKLSNRSHSEGKVCIEGCFGHGVINNDSPILKRDAAAGVGVRRNGIQSNAENSASYTEDTHAHIFIYM